MNVVEFKNISIDYEMKKITLHAVSNVSLGLEKGKITALVGESGSGKTTLATSLINCISSPGRIVSGDVILHSEKTKKDISVVKMNDKELNNYRWNNVSMVFQGAQSALNPIETIFNQFNETLHYHGINLPKKEAREKFVEILKIVNLNENVLDQYPHEISGGMKQRVMIAFSLLLDPEVIILDEPTTALDVITQNYIFSILTKINKERGTTMLLLTHDIAIVAQYADNIGVMYGGRMMEFGTVKNVFKKPLSPYTKGLINSTPSLIKNNDDIKPIPGTPINIVDLPKGCGFAARCEFCQEKCNKHVTEILEVETGHFVYCHKYGKEGE